MQLSPPSISRMLFYHVKLKLYPLNTNSPSFSPLPQPLAIISLPCPYESDYSRTSQKSIQYLSFGDWLISPSVRSSRLIHVVARGRISCFKAEYYSIVCKYHICFLIRPSKTSTIFNQLGKDSYLGESAQCSDNNSEKTACSRQTFNTKISIC